MPARGDVEDMLPSIRLDGVAPKSRALRGALFISYVDAFFITLRRAGYERRVVDAVTQDVAQILDERRRFIRVQAQRAQAHAQLSATLNRSLGDATD
ncbi:MAG: hypothetical protein VX475_01340 [Myxococcota bacterium]|nr:hypothetical protein [Myxococcota bacterium]